MRVCPASAPASSPPNARRKKPMIESCSAADSERSSAIMPEISMKSAVISSPSPAQVPARPASPSLKRIGSGRHVGSGFSNDRTLNHDLAIFHRRDPSPDPFLSTDPQSNAQILRRARCGMPVHAELFQLLFASRRNPWPPSRLMARNLPDFPLSSMGWLRL